MTTPMVPIVETVGAELPTYCLPNPAGQVFVTDELTESMAFETLLATGVGGVDSVQAVLDRYWSTLTFVVLVRDRLGRRYQFSCYKSALRWSAAGPLAHDFAIASNPAKLWSHARATDGTSVMADTAAHLTAALSFLEAWKAIVAYEASPAGRERHARSWYERFVLADRCRDRDSGKQLARRLDQLADEVETRSPFRHWVDEYLRIAARQPWRRMSV